MTYLYHMNNAKYSRKIWVPSFFALLAFAGLGLALTHLHGGIGPYGFFVRGRPAPWYPGALLGVFAFSAMLISLWWYWLPDWEQPRAVLRAEVKIGGRTVPVLMYPYSSSLQVLLVIAGLFITGLGLINSRTFILMVALPILGLLMRGVFGRQFVGLTTDGLMWRVMPKGTDQGGTEIQGRDIFTRQPVQFLPWSAITDVGLADAIPTVPKGERSTRRSRASLMLRVSVSDPEVLAGLTHYQRIVPTALGADVLIPIDRHGTDERIIMGGEGLTRAEPEVIKRTVEHYLRDPEEREKIGSTLGAARLPNEPKELTLPVEVPSMQAIHETQDLKGAAQRVGTRTAKAGQALGGAALGLPYFVTALALVLSGHLPDQNNLFFPITLAYMLLVVLPISAVLSGALAAFAAPDGQEQAYARASLQNYFILILTLGTMTLALEAWQFFDPKNPGHSTISIPWTVGMIVLTLLCLILAGLAGLRIGRTAKASGPAWLARQLGRW